jgi:transcriptional regulator with GAF, ATPase, and Fis domain
MDTQELQKLKNKYDIVGNDDALGRALETAVAVAPTDLTVLITGESGVGKELVANAIHNLSPRKEKSFIKVHCAALSETLLESELFGHEKGAFTSAVKQHKGKFEVADGGTLFLDEIGDMSLAAQAKVLRVLQEKKLSRVGSDKDIEVDVRVIAATNKDLRKEIAEGRFREDLFHRLSVIVIQVPTLAERKDDIPLLIDYFTEQIVTEGGLPRKAFSAEAVKALQEKSWTGNIRELRNVVERLLILGGAEISLQDIRDYVL